MWIELVQSLCEHDALLNAPGARDSVQQARLVATWERVQKLAAKLMKDRAFAAYKKFLTDDMLNLGTAWLLQEVVDADDAGADLAMEAARATGRELWRTTLVQRIPGIVPDLLSGGTLVLRTGKHTKFADVSGDPIDLTPRLSIVSAEVLAWYAVTASELVAMMADGSVVHTMAGKKKPEDLSPAILREHDRQWVAAVAPGHTLLGFRRPDESFEHEHSWLFFDGHLEQLPDGIDFVQCGVVAGRPWVSLKRTHAEAPAGFSWLDGDSLAPTWHPATHTVHALLQFQGRICAGMRDGGGRLRWRDLETDTPHPELYDVEDPVQKMGDRLWTSTGLVVDGETRTQVLGREMRGVFVRSDAELLCIEYAKDAHFLRRGTLLHRP
ncbi:MAG: hypothetical protein MUF64_27855 [Polyangiaceae bacterium]|jgi:hypothetical protein|nr:hypothetical protein [Polyangiaceae bacterium]